MRGLRALSFRRSVFVFHQAELRAFVELAAIKFPAAIEAGHGAPNSADARKIFSAAGALVKVASGPALHRERQRVGARFIANAQVPASFSPLDTMGRQPAPARAELGEEMRQLVPQSSFDFTGVVFAKTWIQGNHGAAEISPAGRAEKAGIPFDMNSAGQFRSVQRFQQFPRFRFQREVPTQDHK